MTTYTTTNDKVQHYLTYSDKKASKHRKIQRINGIKESLESMGKYLDEFFSKKSMRIYDEISYLTTMCGVIKIGRDRLAELAKASKRTVSDVVTKIRKSQELGFFVGYLKDTHKYVFVDLKADNARELLKDIFGLSEVEIAHCFAHPPVAEKLRETRDTDDILVPNNITKNKTITNKKTFTKDGKSSLSTYRSFYGKLKDLFEARTGDLSDFKAYIGVIYGKMKKMRAEGMLGMSNSQLEQIMYQSLDVLLHKQGVKNPLAMLNAIINNKISDMTTPKATPSAAPAAKRTEVLPDWFATRHERVETVISAEEQAELEARRVAVLKKLGLA